MRFQYFAAAGGQLHCRRRGFILEGLLDQDIQTLDPFAHQDLQRVQVFLDSLDVTAARFGQASRDIGLEFKL